MVVVAVAEAEPRAAVSGTLALKVLSLSDGEMIHGSMLEDHLHQQLLKIRTLDPVNFLTSAQLSYK
jgi:hypothetical protein